MQIICIRNRVLTWLLISDLVINPVLLPRCIGDVLTTTGTGVRHFQSVRHLKRHFLKETKTFRSVRTPAGIEKNN